MLGWLGRPLQQHRQVMYPGACRGLRRLPTWHRQASDEVLNRYTRRVLVFFLWLYIFRFKFKVGFTRLWVTEEGQSVKGVLHFISSLA